MMNEDLLCYRLENIKKRRGEKIIGETKRYFELMTVCKPYIETVITNTVKVDGIDSFVELEPSYEETFGINISNCLSKSFTAEDVENDRKIVNDGIVQYVKHCLAKVIENIGTIETISTDTYDEYIMVKIVIKWKTN